MSDTLNAYLEIVHTNLVKQNKFVPIERSEDAVSAMKTMGFSTEQLRDRKKVRNLIEQMASENLAFETSDSREDRIKEIFGPTEEER